MAKHSGSALRYLYGVCVLIVEDDADAADLYGLWLRDAGHRVSIVGDATRALILAPMLRPAVVVVDIGLPGIDGVELVRELRALPELVYCRYVAVSAYAEVSLPARCRAAGFADFFEKPMPRLALVRSVRDAARRDEHARFSWRLGA